MEELKKFDDAFSEAILHGITYETAESVKKSLTSLNTAITDLIGVVDKGVKIEQEKLIHYNNFLTGIISGFDMKSEFGKSTMSIPDKWFEGNNFKKHLIFVEVIRFFEYGVLILPYDYHEDQVVNWYNSVYLNENSYYNLGELYFETLRNFYDLLDKLGITMTTEEKPTVFKKLCWFSCRVIKEVATLKHLIDSKIPVPGLELDSNSFEELAKLTTEDDLYRTVWIPEEEMKKYTK
jgi:hypothetical protein